LVIGGEPTRLAVEVDCLLQYFRLHTITATVSKGALDGNTTKGGRKRKCENANWRYPVGLPGRLIISFRRDAPASCGAFADARRIVAGDAGGRPHSALPTWRRPVFHPTTGGRSPGSLVASLAAGVPTPGSRSRRRKSRFGEEFGRSWALGDASS
jgi:hypothetical protein